MQELIWAWRQYRDSNLHVFLHPQYKLKAESAAKNTQRQRLISKAHSNCQNEPSYANIYICVCKYAICAQHSECFCL